MVVIEHLGLPGIDMGVLQDDSHTPNAPEAIRRRALGAGQAPPDLPVEQDVSGPAQGRQ